MPRPIGYQVGSKGCLNLPQDSHKMIVSGHFFKNPLKKNFAFFWTFTDFCIPKCAPRLAKTLYNRTKWFYQDRLKPPFVRRPLTTRPIPSPLPLPTITDHYRYRPLQIRGVNCKFAVLYKMCMCAFFRSVHLLVQCAMVGQVLQA